MPKIFNREQIEAALTHIDVTESMEEGFVAYSQGRVVVPPVGELVFHDPPGDVHIKYGYIRVRIPGRRMSSSPESSGWPTW